MTDTASCILSAPASDQPDLRAQVEDIEQRFTALRDQVRQIHRLAWLGTRTVVVAHEFRNLLTPVVNYGRAALQADDAERTRTYLAKTVGQADRAMAMAERVLGLATDHAEPIQSVSVMECAQEAVECLCRDPSKDGIALKLDIEPDLKVWTDPWQLVHVLFNLLINAEQATGRGGRITISAHRADDDCVSIQVRDNGSGIPADQVDQVFKLFFTTKKNGDQNGRGGTGLGLALCREFIEEQGGRITVESEVGKGTIFTIILPASG